MKRRVGIMLYPAVFALMIVVLIFGIASIALKAIILTTVERLFNGH